MPFNATPRLPGAGDLVLTIIPRRTQMNAPQSPDQAKVEQVKLLIDGQWVASSTGEWRDVVKCSITYFCPKQM